MQLVFTPASAFSSNIAHATLAGDCWTIDPTSKAAGGADNGYLDCARAHTPGAKSDGSTAEAVANLLQCASAGKITANIVGHGNDGLIITGQGQLGTDPAKFITTWNESLWGPLLGQLRGKASLIKLWACHPGTAQQGADLLYSIMEETGATCMGPTGFLNCGANGFSLEANSTWQVASPGQPKPLPIQAPTPHFLLSIHRWSMKNRLGTDVPLRKVLKIVLRRGANTFSISGDTARGLLRLVDLRTALTLRGALGATVTGRLEVVYADEKKARKSMRYRILNNRLLQSEVATDTYFRCSSEFHQEILSGFG